MKYREIDQNQVIGLAQGANASHPLLRETDLDAERLLSFVHIPKTAGTTLYRYLGQPSLSVLVTGVELVRQL